MGFVLHWIQARKPYVRFAEHLTPVMRLGRGTHGHIARRPVVIDLEHGRNGVGWENGRPKEVQVWLLT